LKYLHTTKRVKTLAGQAANGSANKFSRIRMEGYIPDVGWQIEKLGDRENLEAAGTKIESERVRCFFHRR